MDTGTVKWFNPTKGYGFIAPDNGDQDLFLHISEVQKAGISDLREGQKIKFQVSEQPNGKKAAADISLA